MVTGNIFHYSRNSWPPEEYINRATLQLLDFDSAAPPEQAWRRKLNSDAGILKEFSITFMEAIKMIRLGIRLWSYVREEASQGRCHIDPISLANASHQHPMDHLEGWEVAAYLEVLEESSVSSKLFPNYLLYYPGHFNLKSCCHACLYEFRLPKSEKKEHVCVPPLGDMVCHRRGTWVDRLSCVSKNLNHSNKGVYTLLLRLRSFDERDIRYLWPGGANMESEKIFVAILNDPQLEKEIESNP